MYNKKKNRVNKKTSRSRGGRQTRGINNRVYRPLPTIISPIHNCLLRYTTHLNGFSATGLQYMDLQYYANGMFKPAASASDTSQPDGFASLAALYNNYIVNSCQLDLILVNREDFAVNFAYGFFPGAKSIGSAAEAIDVGEGPFSRSDIISAKGGFDRHEVSRRVQVFKLWDRKYYYGDGAFKPTTTANPSTLAAIVITAVAPAGSTFENGLSCSVRLTFNATFSGRKGTDQVTLPYVSSDTDLEYALSRVPEPPPRAQDTRKKKM